MTSLEECKRLAANVARGLGRSVAVFRRHDGTFVHLPELLVCPTSELVDIAIHFEFDIVTWFDHTGKEYPQ